MLFSLNDEILFWVLSAGNLLHLFHLRKVPNAIFGLLKSECHLLIYSIKIMVRLLAWFAINTRMKDSIKIKFHETLR